MFPVICQGNGWSHVYRVRVESESERRRAGGDGTTPPAEIICNTLGEVKWAVRFYLGCLNAFEQCAGVTANQVAVLCKDWHLGRRAYWQRWSMRGPLRFFSPHVGKEPVVGKD